MSSPDIQIRALKASDIPQLCQLHSALLPVKYPPAFFLQLLVHSTRLCLIAHSTTSPNTPIAFVSAAIQRATEDLPLPSLHRDKCPVSPDKETPAPLVNILTLGVSPSHQRQGIARALVRSVTSRLCASPAHSSPPNVFPRSIPAATIIVAQVATSNTAGQEFYHRLGLRTEQELRGAYKTLGSGQKDAYLVVGQISV